MIITSETLHEHIKILHNAKLEGSLAVFVGSGLSCATDPKKYKSWAELIKALRNALSYNDEQDFLKIAQLYSLEYGSAQTKKILRSNFPNKDQSGTLQKAIINLKPHYIVTTNWDNLLDDAIDNIPGIIDKIATDKDLVQSEKDKKYIKMHGDFTHDNYVFTEDDYLNYTYNFPLIENFVKMVLSTHTVLLIGYSFSDWDLKQIISWIRHNSNVRPPIYMFEKINFPQVTSKYYDNLGIHILPCYKEDYSDYEEQLLKLLNQIASDKPTNILSSPEEYILSILKPLDVYPVILADSITRVLTNSRIIYDSSNQAILQFFKEIESLDNDNVVRETYTNFYKNIKKYDEENNSAYQEILRILLKADIHGISTDSDIFNKKRYYSFNENKLSINENLNKCIDFNFSTIDTKDKSLWNKLLDAYNLFTTENYEKSFNIIEDIIKQSRSENNYAVTFIAMFNYNTLLNKLKYSFSLPANIKKAYRQVADIDMEAEYDNLPQKAKPQVKPVFDFLNFSFIYSKNYKSLKDLNEVRKRKRIIAEGGFSFSSEVIGSRAKLKNIIEFVVNNAICIETYQEFRELCRTYLQTTLENTAEKEIYIDKIDIYTSIKCFSQKDLKDFYSDFYQTPSSAKKLIAAEETIDWLVNTVLLNTINLFIKNGKIVSILGDYCNNALFITSLLPINKNQTKTILETLKKLVNEGNNSIGIFESINSFIGIQYNVLSNKDLDGSLVLSILETLVSKFVDNKVNVHEERVLSQAKLRNVFGLTSVTNTFFSNKKLLEQLLTKVKSMDIKGQLQLLQWLLIPLYQMSDEKCKNLITSFIQKSDIEKAKNNKDPGLMINFIIVKLLFVCLKIETSSDVLKDLIKGTLDVYPKNRFSSNFYSLQEMVERVAHDDNSYDEIKTYVDNFVSERSRILSFGLDDNK